MHVILDTGKAKLWLGGTRACLDTNLLLDNHIQVVWPAAKCAMPTDTAAVRVLPLLDGAGVTRNQPPLGKVLGQVDRVVSLLMAGQIQLLRRLPAA